MMESCECGGTDRIVNKGELGGNIMLFVPGSNGGLDGEIKGGIFLSQRGESQLRNTLVTVAGIMAIVGLAISPVLLNDSNVSQQAVDSINNATPVVRSITPQSTGAPIEPTLTSTPVPTNIADVIADMRTAEAELDVTRTVVAREQDPTPEVMATERAGAIATRMNETTTSEPEEDDQSNTTTFSSDESTEWLRDSICLKQLLFYISSLVLSKLGSVIIGGSSFGETSLGGALSTVLGLWYNINKSIFDKCREEVIMR